mgnify:CR=1 FL=1
MENVGVITEELVASLLLGARKEGVIVRPTPGGFRVLHKGGHEAVRRKLAEHKSEIREFYSGLEQRLRRGQKLLVAADHEIWDTDGYPVGTEQHIQHYMANISLWDDLDALVEPRHCPIGEQGCDLESPVLCRSCGAIRARERRHG